MADAQYRNTVLAAFQNVADALARAAIGCRHAARRSSARVRAASDTLDLARGQYRLGAITYVILLNAQRSYQQARLAVVQAQAARYADTAALFQALGGGWWNRTDVAPDPLQPRSRRSTRRRAIRRTHAATELQSMTKRMVIMLVAVAIVFGGIFGFQVFKARHDQEIHEPPWLRRRRPSRPARPAYSEWQPKIEAVGSLRAVKGADLSLEVSGVVEFDLIQFRRRRRGGRAAFEAALGGRRRQAAIRCRRPRS